MSNSVHVQDWLGTLNRVELALNGIVLRVNTCFASQLGKFSALTAVGTPERDAPDVCREWLAGHKRRLRYNMWPLPTNEQLTLRATLSARLLLLPLYLFIRARSYSPRWCVTPF